MAETPGITETSDVSQQNPGVSSSRGEMSGGEFVMGVKNPGVNLPWG